MAGRGNFALKLDVTRVEGLAERLGKIDARYLGRMVVDGLNEVVDRTYQNSRERMNAGINLEDEYLRRKMVVEHATEGRPVASILARGGAQHATVLGRFDAQPVRVAAVSPKRRLKGFARLGIPVGQKQKGVTVEVTRGSPSDGFVPGGFILPLRAGKVDGGNGFGVFARNRQGRKVHRYGPSVYQLFSFQLVQMEDDIQDDLSNTLLDAAGDSIDKALT
jgi:hypothetical protein